VRLTLRLDLGAGRRLGHGKVRLLELVDETGSIRKAAGQMKMSYRRGWLLLKALDGTFGEALVETATGGRAGGGARLTLAGRLVVKQYRGVEKAATKAAARNLAALSASAGVGSTAKKPGIPPAKAKIRKPR